MKIHTKYSLNCLIILCSLKSKARKHIYALIWPKKTLVSTLILVVVLLRSKFGLKQYDTYCELLNNK